MDTNEAVNPYKYVATDDKSQSVKSNSDMAPNVFDVMKLFRESDGELLLNLTHVWAHTWLYF